MSPAADLRVALSGLLTEHAALAIFAMQKGYANAPDFQAISAQLDQNTNALGNAVHGVYGDAAAQGFLTLWRNHIGFFVDYTVGSATHDQAKRDRAQANLAGYARDISTLFAGANPNLPEPALEQAFDVHIQQLSGALDAYAGGDYARAYQLFDDSHMHMMMAGTVLAGGIVAQFPAQFSGQATVPSRLPNTGDGSCADGGCE
jgi:hypothetical protein